MDNGNTLAPGTWACMEEYTKFRRSNPLKNKCHDAHALKSLPRVIGVTRANLRYDLAPNIALFTLNKLFLHASSGYG